MNVQAAGLEGSRHSPRNRQVSGVLNQAGLATLLIDLLNADEQAVDQQTASSASTSRSWRTIWRRSRNG